MSNALTPWPAPSPDAMEPSPTQAPLAIMTATTPTRLFNDSCHPDELAYSIERGATGATSNPVINLSLLKARWDRWSARLAELHQDHPTWDEHRLGWTVYQEMAVAGAKLLEPTFESADRTWGRLSVQTEPSLHPNAEAMLAQAIELSRLAPNMQVKVPATAAGIAMIEEATFAGVNLNVTVSFTVAQVMAIAEAIERGMRRRDAAGLDTAHMAPVATMMIGRLDDWLKVVAARDQLTVPPEVLDWAGIAAYKRAYELFKHHGFRTKMLAAAYRHLGHWTELVGSDSVLTMPYEWQVKANRCGHHPEVRFDRPVDDAILRQLRTIPDFIAAYEPDGMGIEAFDSYGATRRTLRSFITAWLDFRGLVRDVTLPDPDRF